MTQVSGDSGQRIGRPRVFSDEEAFAATAEAIKKHGYKSLTMGDIAKELRCSPPALMSRFGSKYGLLRAYQAWGNEVTRQRFSTAREQTSTPLEALRFRVHGFRDEGLHEVGELDNQINILGFHVMSWTDPELHDLEAARRTMFLEEITKLIEESVASGELEGCDPESLGRAIVAAIAGATLQWIPEPEKDPRNHLLNVVNEILKPYVVSDETG